MTLKCLIVLLQQSEETLAKWYCLLNCFEHPKGLNGCIVENRVDSFEVMRWIEKHVGEWRVSRMWNYSLSEYEHHIFWEASHGSQSIEAVKKYYEIQNKRIKAEENGQRMPRRYSKQPWGE